MRLALPVIFLLLAAYSAFSQKKPLDPTVYDGWQRIGDEVLSADGKYVAYMVVPQ